MRKKLYLMCGPAGAGKSTYIRNNAARGTSAWVSRDRVRFKMVKETEAYFSKEDAVFAKWCSEIVNALNSSWIEEVWVDATHIGVNSRNKTLKQVDKTLRAVGGIQMEEVDIIPVVIMPTLEKCLEHNALREGREYVPETVVKNMYNSFR